MAAGDEVVAAEAVPEGIEDVVGLALGTFQPHAIRAEGKQEGARLAGLVVVDKVAADARSAGELVGAGLAKEECGVAAEAGEVKPQMIALDAGLAG